MTVYETPSVAGQSRSSFFGRLKTDFLPKWDDHVHKDTVLPSLIAQKKGTMGGYESLGSILTAFPQSAGIFQFEDETLPTPRVGTYIQPIVHARGCFTRLRWTLEVELAAQRGDRHAWAKPRMEDMKKADDQMRLNFARNLYLGPYQPCAIVSAFNGTTTWTLYGRNARTSNADDFAKFGSHYLRVNQSIDFVNASGGAVDYSGQALWAQGTGVAAPSEPYITAIDNSDPTAPTLTLSVDPSAASVADPADESLIFPWASRRSAVDPGTDLSRYAGMNGLLQICQDNRIYANLYDLVKGDYSSLNGKVNRDAAGVSRAFDEDYVTLTVDECSDEGVGDEPTNLLMHRSVRREYVKDTKGDRRFQAVQTEKGFGKLTFHAGDSMLPVTTDRDCVPGLIFVLNTRDWYYLEQSPLGPVDSQKERFVDGKAAHEIVLHKSGNVVCETPFNNGMIDDITFNVSDLT